MLVGGVVSEIWCCPVGGDSCSLILQTVTSPSDEPLPAAALLTSGAPDRCRVRLLVRVVPITTQSVSATCISCGTKRSHQSPSFIQIWSLALGFLGCIQRGMKKPQIHRKQLIFFCGKRKQCLLPSLHFLFWLSIHVFIHPSPLPTLSFFPLFPLLFSLALGPHHCLAAP